MKTASLSGWFLPKSPSAANSARRKKTVQPTPPRCSTSRCQQNRNGWSPRYSTPIRISLSPSPSRRGAHSTASRGASICSHGLPPRFSISRGQALTAVTSDVPAEMHSFEADLSRRLIGFLYRGLGCVSHSRPAKTSSAARNDFSSLTSRAGVQHLHALDLCGLVQAENFLSCFKLAWISSRRQDYAGARSRFPFQFFRL